MDDATLVVLGASGDMARRLLFPALLGLEQQKRLGKLKIIAYARRDWTREQMLEIIELGVRKLAGMDPAKTVWQRLARRISFVQGDLVTEDLARLKDKIGGNAAFYLALPPGVFCPAAEAMAEAGLNDEGNGWRRIVLEKPFGTDLESAKILNQRLHRSWDESQIFRIDHYLGKETVQNILMFRFANRFLEPILSSNHVDHVQITAAETLGLEGRTSYYDDIGALRDMLQSHLMQLMAVVAMEPLSAWNSDVLHDHKAEVLRSVRLIRPEDVEKQAVRGQYGRGRVGRKQHPAYNEEQDIDSASRTETFAALKLYIDNWRWAGTPFYLRSGKRLAAELTEVSIHFKQPPFRLNSEQIQPAGNRLVFRLRPHESLNLFVQARAPGLTMKTEELVLHADYDGADSSSASYHQLLIDLLEGERTAFLRFDEVEWAWRIIDPVIEAWKQGQPDPYAPGSNGPDSQHNLMGPGQHWHDLHEDSVPAHA